MAGNRHGGYNVPAWVAAAGGAPVDLGRVWDSDGSNEKNYINIGRDTVWDFGTRPFSVESYARATGGNGTHRHIARWDDESFNGLWNLKLSAANQLQCELYSANRSTNTTLTTSSTYLDSLWHHFVLVRQGSGGSVYLYADGVQVASGSDVADIVASTGAKLVLCGAWLGNVTNQFIHAWFGQIAYVRIFGKALNVDEVKQLRDHPFSLLLEQDNYLRYFSPPVTAAGPLIGGKLVNNSVVLGGRLVA
jgi:hypothetical protein